MRPPVLRPYHRRSECLNICQCHSELIKTLYVGLIWGLNPQPAAWQSSALQHELLKDGFSHMNSFYSYLALNGYCFTQVCREIQFIYLVQLYSLLYHAVPDLLLKEVS